MFWLIAVTANVLGIKNVVGKTSFYGRSGKMEKAVVRIIVIVAMLTCITLGTCDSANSGTVNSVATGDWADTSPYIWSTGALPLAGDDVYIRAGNTVTLSTTTTPTLTGFYVAVASQSGTFNQTGGVLNISGQFMIGDRNNPGTGNYNLSGTGVLNAGTIKTASNWGGYATITQGAGTQINTTSG